VKLIASWGSSGAGKSTLAVAVAAKLAADNKDVLIIGADSRTPALPFYLPGAVKFTAIHSIGSLWETSGGLSESALKDKLHRHPGDGHIYVMGYASGEIASVTYRAPERGTVAGLLQLLRDSPFEYAIIDCDSNPIYDGLTLYALEYADVVLRTATPDIKGYEGLKAQLGWLDRNDRFDVGRHVRIANNVYESTPLKEASALFGGFDLTLPHAPGVRDRISAGKLPRGLDEPRGISFESGVGRLCQKIMEEEYGEKHQRENVLRQR